MPDLVDRLREWLGVPHTPDAQKQLLDGEVLHQNERLLNIARRKGDDQLVRTLRGTVKALRSDAERR